MLFSSIHLLALNNSLSLSAGEGDIPLREKKVRPFSMFDSIDSDGATGMPTTGTLRKNQSSEDLLRDGQVQKMYYTFSVIILFCFLSTLG